MTNSIRITYSSCIISNTYIKLAVNIKAVNICALVFAMGGGGRETAVTASHDYINQPLKK